MQNAGPEYKHMIRFMQSHTQFFGLISGPANFSVQNRNNPPYAFLQLIFWQGENDPKPAGHFAVEGFSRRKENLGFDEFSEQGLLSFESILVGWEIGPEVAPKEETCVPTLVIRNVRCSEEPCCMAIIFGNTASRMLDE